MCGLAFFFLATGCPRRFDPRAEELPAGSPAAVADYRGARQLLDQGDARGAEQALQRFSTDLAADPLAPQATLLRARAALTLGDAVRARDMLLPLVGQGAEASALQQRARHLLGLAHYRLQEARAALSLLMPFSATIVEGDEAVELHATLADLLHKEGRPAEALAELARVLADRAARPAEVVYARELGARLCALLPAGEQAAARRRLQLPESGVVAAGAGARALPRVGLVLPLSGPERALGERVLRGALAAADFFAGADSAAADPGKRAALELRARDCGKGLSAEQAEALVSELAREGVAALIGPPTRGATTDRLVQAARAAGLPFLDLSPPAAAAGPANGAVHLLRANSARARAMARYLQSQRVSTAAVLAPKSPYGAAMTRAFVEELSGKGVRVVAQLSYPEGQTTFITQARELLSLRPEAIFVPAAANQVALIAAQLASSAVIATQHVPVGKEGNARFLATADGLGERLLRDAGRYLQGAVLAPLSAGALPMDSAAAQTLWTRYQRPGGEEPGALDALGFDALRVIAAGCSGGTCTPSALQQRLPGLAVDGATGPLCFDAEGQRRGPLLLLQVEGARLRPVPAPRSAGAAGDGGGTCAPPPTS